MMMLAHPAWKQARSLHDLSELTVDFLEGRLPNSPMQRGGPDAETVPLIQDLVRINRRGLVTTMSQPGQGHSRNGQRALLEGIITGSQLHQLEEGLRDSGLVVIMYGHGAEAWATIPVTIDDDGEPFTFAGRWSYKELDHYRNRHSGLDAELNQACGVEIFDPEWGRNNMWGAIISALEQTRNG